MLTEVDDTALLVAPSPRAQLKALMVIAAFLPLYVVAGLTGVVPPALAILGCVVFGVVLGAGVLWALKLRNVGWQLRLDATGVTVAGTATVPWGQIAEVRVTGLRPRWLFWFSLGYRVVAFIPQPGTAMAPLPAFNRSLWGGTLPRYRLRAVKRLYGSELVVPPSTVSASSEQLAEAVERWSDIPVR